jgi:hypothetical protein
MDSRVRRLLCLQFISSTNDFDVVDVLFITCFRGCVIDVFGTLYCFRFSLVNVGAG